MKSSKQLRIVYMGTPEFAAESLRTLVEGGYNVVAVVTMPDKPAGRGHRMQQSAVKQYALQAGLPVLQPERLKDEQFLLALRSYEADMQIVVAFRMLPEVVWSMPPMGTFNLHASLLPQYRGAAPINWAVINGEQQTGVTTFLLQHEIDTGNILLQRSIQIGPREDAGSVHDRLMMLGAQTVVDTVELLASGNAHPIAQDELSQQPLKPAPKIFKETCRLRFDTTADNVMHQVLGLAPYPGAWFDMQLEGMTEPMVCKVYEVEPVTETPGREPGCLMTDYKTYIRVATTDGYVELRTIQLPGKRRMSVRDVLNGIH
ncbi:MAG: methionyl-tRNA formyltransferase [Paludibacteraceae bacterium]|nr:methionyl-tRNA formyltransferase [Paludibacteraceae bacterium]